MPTLDSLLILGGGVMGLAIAQGALNARLIRPSDLHVAEPDPARRAALSALGLRAYAGPALAIRAVLDVELGPPARRATPILLAVKPQVFPTLVPDLAPLAHAPSRLVLSIMAGTRAATIHDAIAPHTRVIRAMPNTPARVAQGVTGISPGPGATPDDLSLAHHLFSALGPVVETIDESLMDAFTAVAGSGPAYLFHLARAMEDAAIALGFEPAAARRVVSQTLQGAAALLDGSDPAALRDAVTSKGGTTAAALGVLDQARAADTLIRAITAATDRARELAR